MECYAGFSTPSLGIHSRNETIKIIEVKIMAIPSFTIVF
jgi:hypothetical protein